MVERRVQNHGEGETGHEPSHRLSRRPFQQGKTHHGEDRRGTAVHDRGAKAPHDPGAHAGVRNQMQEVQVLDCREPGTDCKAEDRRIDKETNPMGADQCDDDESFQKLLGNRRDIARELRQVDAHQLERISVCHIAGAGYQCTSSDNGDDRA